jgi:hypothetical protein
VCLASASSGSVANKRIYWSLGEPIQGINPLDVVHQLTCFVLVVPPFTWRPREASDLFHGVSRHTCTLLLAVIIWCAHINGDLWYAYNATSHIRADRWRARKRHAMANMCPGRMCGSLQLVAQRTKCHAKGVCYRWRCNFFPRHK